MSRANASKLISELGAQRQKVDVDNFDLTLLELSRMTVEGELVRAPAYQRKFRWDIEDQSRLIESLFLGLPVPTIYVASNDDGTWDLVDGLQRISTIMHFMAEPEGALAELGLSEPLRLKGLTTVPQLNGETYASLPLNVRMQFSRRFMRLTALSDKSDYEVRFEMFERLNRGGMALTPQEVRACIFRGPFIETISALAESAEFQSLIKLRSASKEDGTAEELVLKFFAYGEARAQFKGSVVKFLNEYTERVRQSFDHQQNRELFLKVTERLSDILGNKPLLRPKTYVTPLNEFEAVMVAAGEMILAGEKIQQPHDRWLEDAKLVKLSSKGTNAPRALNGRIDRARDLLSGTPPTLK